MTPPIGAYCRIMASQLIFRAALRYLSDSERSDVERWDISGEEKNKSLGNEHSVIEYKSKTHCPNCHLATGALPYSSSLFV